MKISYNWLKDYVTTDLTPTEISEILTETGLEVDGIEKIEGIKGGYEYPLFWLVIMIAIFFKGGGRASIDSSLPKEF